MLDLNIEYHGFACFASEKLFFLDCLCMLLYFGMMGLDYVVYMSLEALLFYIFESTNEKLCCPLCLHADVFVILKL